MPIGLSTMTDLTVSGGEPLAWGKRTYVMGIINVTPDSFSGDGVSGDASAAVEQAIRFQEEGADLIDVGAESTRPGHQPVSEAEELARLIPALDAISASVSIPVSVDTWKSGVAMAALDHGASIINDVWGLRADPLMAEVAAGHGTGLIIMHNQSGHRYNDLMPDIAASLLQSVDMALSAGVPRENIVIDPGFGFGKTADHNLELLKSLRQLKELGLPLLVGTSRKSTIGRILGLPPEQRVAGTAATVAIAIAGGADIVRVHDVREMVRVCRMTDAVVRGWRPDGWEAAT